MSFLETRSKSCSDLYDCSYFLSVQMNNGSENISSAPPSYFSLLSLSSLPITSSLIVNTVKMTNWRLVYSTSQQQSLKQIDHHFWKMFESNEMRLRIETSTKNQPTLALVNSQFSTAKPKTINSNP